MLSICKSCSPCCRDSLKSEEIPIEDGNKRVVTRISKDGRTTTTTTIITTSIDKQPSMNPSKVPLLPPDTTLFTSPKRGKSSNSNFEIDCLNEHNRLRALHGCPPLKLNPKLSAISKDWAIRMADANTMKHSQKYPYGENLYMCSGFTLHGSKVAESWYNEIKNYNFQRPGFSTATGHFTQVIWRDSKELGVGVEIRDNTTWVAAHYNPPGNVQSMFAENVPRLLAKN